MGACDGVSLGSVIFPSSPDRPNHEYRALGMSIGLLTTFMANLGSLVGSGFDFAAGGALIPTIVVLASYFKGDPALGPAQCPTIYVMLVVATLSGSSNLPQR